MTDFQIECGCNNCRMNNCFNRILFILSVLAAFTVGLIIGAVFAGILFLVLPALIAIAVILIILVIITAIYRRCSRSDCNSCCG